MTTADAEDPAILFFDHEWGLLEEFSLVRQDESPYNIEVYEVPEMGTMQVFVAGKDTISVIEMVKHENGETMFQITLSAFESYEEQEYDTDQTYIAKSSDFLIIKQSNRRSLGLMPICQYKYIYEQDSYQCAPCERGLKSYGLQDDKCITCMRAWLQGTNDEFKQAQYQQFCHDGYEFSVVLFAVVPSLTCLLALVCCICHRGNGIKGEKELCSDADFQKPKRKLVRERGQRTYVRRQGSKYYEREYRKEQKMLEMDAIKSIASQ